MARKSPFGRTDKRPVSNLPDIQRSILLNQYPPVHPTVPSGNDQLVPSFNAAATPSRWCMTTDNKIFIRIDRWYVRQVGKTGRRYLYGRNGLLRAIATMTAEHMRPGWRGSWWGRSTWCWSEGVSDEGGSFTLTSGIASEMPARNGTCVAMINGAINSWVLGAQELNRTDGSTPLVRGWWRTAMNGMGLFSWIWPVPMGKVVNAYVLSVEGAITGKILKVYAWAWGPYEKGKNTGSTSNY